MIDTIIPLDNADGEPAVIRIEDWRREHAFMEAQRERPVAGAKLWRGIRFAMLPSLVLWICLTALFAWALFG